MEPRPPSADHAAALAWGAELVESLALDFQFQYCAALLYDPVAGALRLVGQRWGAGEDLGVVRPGDVLVPLERSVCGAVYRARAAVLIADVRQHPDYRSFPGAPMRSELAVPLWQGDEVIGVLNVESPRVATFDIVDLDRLSRRAAQAAEHAPRLRVLLAGAGLSGGAGAG